MADSWQRGGMTVGTEDMSNFGLGKRAVDWVTETGEMADIGWYIYMEALGVNVVAGVVGCQAQKVCQSLRWAKG